MFSTILRIAAALGFIGAVSTAEAQIRVVSSCGSTSPFPAYNTGTVGPATMDANGNLCTGVTVTATVSISPFKPTPAYATPVSVTSTNTSTALPSNTGTVIVYNVGSAVAYVTLASGAATATSASNAIQPGSWMAFSTTGFDHIGSITTGSDTTTLNLAGGSGQPSGSGGGGGSGGGVATSVNQGNSGSQAWLSTLYQGGSAVATGNGLYVQPSTSATWAVTATSLPLPTGAATVAAQNTGNGSLSTIATNTAGLATAANQTTGNTSLSTIATNSGTAATAANQTSVEANAGVNASKAIAVQGIAGGSSIPVTGTFFQATQPISAAALPLPSGAATSANQTTEITNLSNIATNTGVLATDAHLTSVMSAFGAAPTQAITIQGNAGGTAIPVTGTLSASVGGFTPTPNYTTPLSVTNSSGRTTLPTGTSVIAYNVGSNVAYCALGNGSVTATTANDVIQPNSWLEFTVGTATDIACITASSTTTVNLSGGAGLMTGAGGGSGGSGSGGTVTQGNAGSTAQAWYVNPTQGGAVVGATNGLYVQPGTSTTFAISAAALPLPSGAATAANQSSEISDLASLITNTTGIALDATVATGNTTLSTIATNTNGVATAANQTSVINNPATSGSKAVSIQGVTSGVAIPVSGTFWQTTQPVSIGSGGIASGAVASGAFASGSVASGAIASGAFASGSISANAAASGAFPAGSIADLAHGQGTMAASVPVAIASNQSAVPASQSGTWNITNVSGTVSLPTGASTSANQATELTDLTNIATNQTNLTGTKNAGTAAANSQLVGAVYNSTPLTLTNAQQASLQGDANGFLKVNIAAGMVSNFAATFPSAGAAIGAEALSAAPTWTNGNMAPLWVATSGGLMIDAVSGGTLMTALGNGVTQDNHAFTQGSSYDISFGCLYSTAYSGATSSGNLTVPQCDQFGRLQVTGAVASGSTAAGFPVLVGGSDGTNARSLATDSSGRVKSDIFGNAGATLDVAAAGATSATNAIQVAGQYLSPQPTISSGQSTVLQVDANGNLKVNIQTGAGSGGTAANDNAAFVQGTTPETPMGCLYKTSYANASSGSNTIPRCDISGQMIVVGAGAAGAAAGGVMTVQGSATGTAIPTSLAALPALATGSNTVGKVDILGNAGGTLDTAAGSPAATGLTVQGFGAAGTASGGVLTVQGAASMTPVATNLTQVNGTTLLAGVGVAGAGSPRVTVASDPQTIAGSAVGVAGTASANVVTVQGVASMTPVLVNVASGGIASGAVASGAVASGAIASGAFASGSISANAAAAGAFPDTSLTQLGGMTVARSTATDTTSVGVIPLLKEISFMAQTPAALPANQSVNVAQVNGVTTLMGAGATGTGSQRNTVAQDTTTIAGSAPGTAGTASANVVTVQGVASMTPVATSLASIGSQYPTGAVPETISATGTTAATTGTLAAASGKTTYICGFAIRANATAAVTGNATVTGVITGTMNFTQWTAPLASGLGVTEEVFAPCIPASATNTTIAVVSAAPGTGGVVSVSAWGYQL